VTQSLFEQAGGEVGLRAIIDDFIDHTFSDPMIGFFFAKADKARVKEKEYEFAAGHLGANVAYTGRPLPHAHSAHPITGGHFMRRLQILKETLERHAAPPSLIAHWLEHTERMRPFITKQAGSSCDEALSSAEATSPSPPALGASNAQPTVPTGNPAGTEKPMPSVDEINAYLERSAALTKKRLPLMFGALTPAAVEPAATSTGPEPAKEASPQRDSTSRALPLVNKR
jgi:hemoglobin